MTDLLIAGSGPAGLLTALHARAAGLDVLVVDPRTDPIDKACGEGLMPGTLRELRGVGLDPIGDLPGHDFHGIRYLDGARTAEARFRAGPGRGVQRSTLQSVLAELGADRGVRRIVGRVGEFHQSDTGVTAAVLTSTGEITVTAAHLVGADGLHSQVRRRIGAERPDTGAPRWGLRRHLAVAPWSDLVEVYWAADAEAYVTPVGDAAVSIAVLSSRRASFDDQLARFPSLARRVRTVAVDEVRGAGPLRQRVRSRVSGRVLLVGDAAGYLDALTGEGIDVAARTARRLVQCLVTGRPAQYPSLWRRESRRSRWITGALLATARRAPVRRRLVALAGAHPRVFDAAVHQLTR